MKELLELIARSLVSQPEAVRVQEERHDRQCRLWLQVAPEDMGKVIGRGGQIARAIRMVVRAAAVHEGVAVRVDIGDQHEEPGESGAPGHVDVEAEQAAAAPVTVATPAHSPGTGTPRPAWARRRRSSQRSHSGRFARTRSVTGGSTSTPNLGGPRGHGEGSRQGGGPGEGDE